MMLLTCALQEGGVITNQATPQPIREKSYTLGRSYDTASGRVVTMTTRDETSDITMTSGCIEKVMSETSRLSIGDDVITGGLLITIPEVKTPTSPLEPAPSVYDIRGDVISGVETGAGGSRMLEGGDSGICLHSPLLHLSPAPALGHLTGRMSPSIARVVC